MVRHREIRRVEHELLIDQIKKKAHQSQQEDDRPDYPRYSPYVFCLKVFCHHELIPFTFGLSV